MSTEFNSAQKERCQSGRMGYPGKVVCPKGHRGFESLSLRIVRHGASGLLSRPDSEPCFLGSMQSNAAADWGRDFFRIKNGSLASILRILSFKVRFDDNAAISSRWVDVAPLANDARAEQANSKVFLEPSNDSFSCRPGVKNTRNFI